VEECREDDRNRHRGFAPPKDGGILNDSDRSMQNKIITGTQHSDILPQDLLRILLAIESDMGRVRRERWESRIIDLDILLYGREIINEDDLTIPHPLMHLRKFVLVPLVQLAPDLIHPSLGVTMAELLGRIQNNGQEVVPLGD